MPAVWIEVSQWVPWAITAVSVGVSIVATLGSRTVRVVSSAVPSAPLLADIEAAETRPADLEEEPPSSPRGQGIEVGVQTIPVQVISADSRLLSTYGAPVTQLCQVGSIRRVHLPGCVWMNASPRIHPVDLCRCCLENGIHPVSQRLTTTPAAKAAPRSQGFTGLN